MKSGAGDDPFADDAQNDVNDENESDEMETTTEPSSSGTDGGVMTNERQSQSESSATELPYKYRRSSVKEGRTQQPMFLQTETETLVEDTLTDIKSQFDEDVYKTDVVEAMIVAGGEETTPQAVLRRWGYGMKNS